MKKGAIIFSVWAILSIILFIILINSILIIPKNTFQISLAKLSEKQEVLKLDFEKVYLEPNYSISSVDNSIVIKLKEKNAGLNLYYSTDKEFIKSEAIGAAAFTSHAAYIFVWCVIAFLSIALGWVLIGLYFVLLDAIQN